MCGGEGGDGGEGGEGGCGGGGVRFRRTNGAEGDLRTVGVLDGIGSSFESSSRRERGEELGTPGGAGGGGVLPLNRFFSGIRFLVIRFSFKSSSGPPGVFPDTAPGAAPGVSTERTMLLEEDGDNGLEEGGGVAASTIFLFVLPFFLLRLPFMVT